MTHPASLVKPSSTPTTQPSLEFGVSSSPPSSSRSRAGSFMRSLANTSPSPPSSSTTPNRRHSTQVSRRSPSLSDALHSKLLTLVPSDGAYHPADTTPFHTHANLSSVALSDSNWANKYDDFDIREPIGYGSSAVVYQAIYRPLNKQVALKMIDLDMFERNQIDELRRETALMALSKHTNVLKVYGSFVHGSKLYIITPYLNFGSCLDIMKTSFQEGFEEISIATILKQALEGLVYLHKNGHIHRDVKAGNLLMDDQGTVLLADFGVSSSLTENSEVRKTFVGTPCWMAPEVMEQETGYDFKADIWSFGITAIELATGHAPFAKYSPLKVLKLTLSNAPPTLDREHTKHRYSKTFQDMIDACLQKKPENRPSASKLLQHPFFKQARKKEYLCKSILLHVPPLDQRPHKRVPEKRISVENSAQWDFDDDDAAAVPTTSSPVPMTSAPAPPSKRHITFSDARVVHGQAERATTPPASSSSSNSSMSPTLGPALVATPVPVKKSRFIIAEGDTDTTPPAAIADDTAPKPEDLAALGISPASTKRMQRFSVSSQDQLVKPESILSATPIPAKHVAFHVDTSPAALLRVASSDNLVPERKSRFEIQHSPLEPSPMTNLSREGSHTSLTSFQGHSPHPASQSPQPVHFNAQHHRGSRFSIIEKLHPNHDSTTGSNYSTGSNSSSGSGAGTTAVVLKEDSRKVGRFELTVDNSSSSNNSTVNANNNTQPILHAPPPVTASQQASSRSPMDMTTLYHQLDTLLKQTDAQKALVQDLMTSVQVQWPPSSASSTPGTRSRAVSVSSEPSTTTIDSLQHQLALAHRDKERLIKENETLKREVDRLRQQRAPEDP
ncbi:kinase-like domain-containing protein [Gongronella butleri]|nr:kinase-like domain-containing protein [Gongronella butleri]